MPTPRSAGSPAARPGGALASAVNPRRDSGGIGLPGVRTSVRAPPVPAHGRGGFGRTPVAERSFASHALTGGAAQTTAGGGNPRPAGRTSKRNEAQEGSDSSAPATARAARGPDDGARPRGRLPRPSHHAERVPQGAHRARRWSRGNGEGATAAVTRYGCRRGFFEGFDPAQRGSIGRSDHRSGARGAETRANPRIGSGMQQARASQCGGSRRGGAKPRGRNRTPGDGSLGAEARTGRLRGSGRTASMSMEGRAGGAVGHVTAPPTKPTREGHTDQGDR